MMTRLYKIGCQVKKIRGPISFFGSNLLFAYVNQRFWDATKGTNRWWLLVKPSLINQLPLLAMKPRSGYCLARGEDPRCKIMTGWWFRLKTIGSMGIIPSGMENDNISNDQPDEKSCFCGGGSRIFWDKPIWFAHWKLTGHAIALSLGFVSVCRWLLSPSLFLRICTNMGHT